MVSADHHSCLCRKHWACIGFFIQNHFYCSVVTTELIGYKQPQNSHCQLHKQIFTLGHKTSPKAALRPGINSFTVACWRKPFYHLEVKNTCSKPNHCPQNNKPTSAKVKIPYPKKNKAEFWKRGFQKAECPSSLSLQKQGKVHSLSADLPYPSFLIRLKYLNKGIAKRHH